jgi:hypothetical protein
MAQSARFRQLERGLKRLRANLLPKTFSPVGDYSPYVLDKARAYRLLTHAEFEHFLEERCLGIAEKSVENWLIKKRHSRTVLSLLARCGLKDGEKKPDQIDGHIKLALAKYRNLITNNNGIRQHNLFTIIPPIGIDESDIVDTTWIAAVDSFGYNRGEVAHKSLGARVSIDPRSELQNVTQIYSGFERLDQQIIALR